MTFWSPLLYGRVPYIFSLVFIIIYVSLLITLPKISKSCVWEVFKNFVCKYQGSLKGESVVAAILSSRMEQSYCTSGIFRFQARFLTSSANFDNYALLAYVFHPTRNLIRTSRGNINVPKTCKRRTFSKLKNLRFQNYDDYNCIFGIKSKGLSLSFIWRFIQWN